MDKEEKQAKIMIYYTSLLKYHEDVNEEMVNEEDQFIYDMDQMYTYYQAELTDGCSVEVAAFKAAHKHFNEKDYDVTITKATIEDFIKKTGE